MAWHRDSPGIARRLVDQGRPRRVGGDGEPGESGGRRPLRRHPVVKGGFFDAEGEKVVPDRRRRPVRVGGAEPAMISMAIFPRPARRVVTARIRQGSPSGAGRPSYLGKKTMAFVPRNVGNSPGPDLRIPHSLRGSRQGPTAAPPPGGAPTTTARRPAPARRSSRPSSAGIRSSGIGDVASSAPLGGRQNSIRRNALIPIRSGTIVPTAPITRLTATATVIQNRNCASLSTSRPPADSSEPRK